MRRDAHGDSVLLNYSPQLLFHIPLEPPVLDVQAAEQIPVALFMPAEVVFVPPGGKVPEGLHRLAKVLLHYLTEAVDAPVVYKVLHTGLGNGKGPGRVSEACLERVRVWIGVQLSGALHTSQVLVSNYNHEWHVAGKGSGT